MKNIIARAAGRAQLNGGALKYKFPIIVRSGINEQGSAIHYLFNYSDKEQAVTNQLGKATDLLTGTSVSDNSPITLQPWGVAILEQR